MATIKVIKENFVWKVQLNRPERRNAFAPEMIQELTNVFKLAQQNEELQAIVLSGEGPSFCSGADLEWMKSMAEYDLSQNKKDSLELFEMFETARKCTIPVVGQAHGHVMGGALGLLAVCDVVAANENTKFGFSEVKLGLVPAVISPFILEKMNPSQARRWMITGQVFNAHQALESGLVHFVDNEVQVNEFVQSLLNQLCQCGPQAVRHLKQLLNDLPSLSGAEIKERTSAVIAERRVSKEGQEGLRSFFAKKAPSWVRKFK